VKSKEMLSAVEANIPDPLRHTHTLGRRATAMEANGSGGEEAVLLRIRGANQIAQVEIKASLTLTRIRSKC